MNRIRLRTVAILYVLLMLFCGMGYARWDNYTLDGDAVAFMDIADAIHAHHWALAVNGYWNPAYAAVLAMGQMAAHPTRWQELAVYFWVNFFVFAGCIVACILFVSALNQVRRQFVPEDDTLPALSPPALLLISLALLFVSFQRELALATVRSDALLLFFFLLAATCLLRLQSSGRFVFYPLLGLALGCAYLTKSFAFLPSGILLAALFVYGITRKRERRMRIVGGVLVAGALYVALAGPYIYGISKQRGRFTTGESARLNYCFFVDETGRWHEWHSGDLGHAKANFKHHEELLTEHPPVYSYDKHPLGTYPLWFDPSYWTDTLIPQVYIHGHILRLERTSQLLVRFIVGHLEPFVVGAVLLLLGCAFGIRKRRWLPLVPALLWGLLMLGIYFPVDLQDRYLTAPFLLVVIPALAMLRRPRNGQLSEAAGTGIALLLAGVVAATALSQIAEDRRLESVRGFPGGAYSPEIFPAAHGLANLGLAPGTPVACFGDDACYVDHYWARLASTPIRAEIEVPDGSDPGAFWLKQTPEDQQAALDALRSRHIRAVVAKFHPAARIGAGWRQLGTSDFYVYML